MKSCATSAEIVLIPIDIAIIGTAKLSYQEWRLDKWKSRAKVPPTGMPRMYFCHKALMGKLLKFLFRWDDKRQFTYRGNGRQYKFKDYHVRRKRNRDFSITVRFKHIHQSHNFFEAEATYANALTIIHRYQSELFARSEINSLWVLKLKSRRGTRSQD